MRRKSSQSSENRLQEQYSHSFSTYNTLSESQRKYLDHYDTYEPKRPDSLNSVITTELPRTKNSAILSSKRKKRTRKVGTVVRIPINTSVEKILQVSAELLSLQSDTLEKKIHYPQNRLTAKHALRLVLYIGMNRKEKTDIGLELLEDIKKRCVTHRFEGDWGNTAALLRYIGEPALIIEYFRKYLGTKPDFFNLLFGPESQILLSDTYIVVRTKRSVKYPQRHRGYNDKGSRRPAEKFHGQDIAGYSEYETTLRNLSYSSRESITNYLYDRGNPVIISRKIDEAETYESRLNLVKKFLRSRFSKISNVEEIGGKILFVTVSWKSGKVLYEGYFTISFFDFDKIEYSEEWETFLHLNKQYIRQSKIKSNNG